MQTTTFPSHRFSRNSESGSLFLVASILLHVTIVASFLSLAPTRSPSLELVEVELFSNAVTTPVSVPKKIATRKATSAPRQVITSHEGELAKQASVAPTSATSSLSEKSSPAKEDAAATTIFAEDAVDVPAKLLTSPKPKYPARALQAGMEADVALTLVVDASGQVIKSELVQRAGDGFDEAALQAATQLRFAPAEKTGSRVVVRMRWTCRFRIDS